MASRWLPLPIDKHGIAFHLRHILRLNILRMVSRKQNLLVLEGTSCNQSVGRKKWRIQTGRESMGATQHGRLIWSHDMISATGSCDIQQAHPSHRSKLGILKILFYWVMLIVRHHPLALKPTSDRVWQTRQQGKASSVNGK